MPGGSPPPVSVDINSFPAYIRHGWDKLSPVPNPRDDGWHTIPAVNSGRRMIRVERIPFKNIEIPGFFSMKPEQLENLSHPAMYLTSLGG